MLLLIAIKLIYGYTQQAGTDFSYTFSLITKLTFIIVLLTIAIAKRWHLSQLDVNNVFLNGDLFEDVCMDLILGYKHKGSKLVCKLIKSLYGLRQASHQWFCKFWSTLLRHGFIQSKKWLIHFWIWLFPNITFIFLKI